MKNLLKVSILISLAGLIACGPSEKEKSLMKQSKAMFGTLPDKMPGSESDTPAIIELGKKLYSDTKLSVNNTQSCNSCHNVNGKAGGVDNLPTSPGAFGKTGDRNSPTVLNAGFHFVQFWDGRAADLKAQAKGPILNPGEMAMPNEKAVIDKLSADAEYPALFKKAYPDAKEPLTYDSLANAIAAFERTLITHDRFDDFMNGKNSALSSEEQKGLETFIATGCTACHNGAALGGNSFRKMGQVNSYSNVTDTGRFNVTKKAEDKYFFKVPSLRNIKLTSPFFHDGSAKTLEDAVTQMAYLQLGKKLSKEEAESISRFLGSLTDKTRL